MKTLYDITKKYAAKSFVLNNKFLLRLTKQNKITRNRYRQFLNIKKQKTNIRRHTSPNSSLFYKSKTKKRKNTHSKKSV
jgi:hypothetical protein